MKQVYRGYNTTIVFVNERKVEKDISKAKK